MSFNGLRSRSKPIDTRKSSNHETKLLMMNEKAENIASRISNSNSFMATSNFSKKQIYDNPENYQFLKTREYESFDKTSKNYNFIDNIENLDQFLDNLGLAEYVNVFKRNEISLEDLPLLSKDDLIDLKIPIGPRNRILNILRSNFEIRSDPSSKPPRPQKVEKKDEVDLFLSQLSLMTKQSESKGRPSSRMSSESTTESVQSQNYDALAYLVRDMGEKQNMMLKAIEESQRSIATLINKGQIPIRRNEHYRKNSGSSDRYL